MTILLLTIMSAFLFSSQIEAATNIDKHCERITLEKLKVDRTPGRSGDHVVTDGKGIIVRFRTRPAAVYAYSKMKGLDLSLVCYDSKETRDFTFFLTSSGEKPRARDNANDHCQKFILPIEVQEQRRLFRRYYVISARGEGRSSPSVFGEFESSVTATRVAETLEKFEFDSFCQDRARPNGFSWLGDSTAK